MSVQKIDHRDLSISAARVYEVIELSRFWLGIGDERAVQQLKALAPGEVLIALQAGKCAAWQGWTIRTTPLRRIGLPLGQTERVAGIIAVSAHGFVSGPRVAVDCVQGICAEIATIEKRRLFSRAAEIRGPGRIAWELDDS